MAAVLEKKDPAATFDSQVDEQLAQTTSRIRAHDLAFGGLVIVALVLVYATAMIVLDKYLNLPEWVRQVSLAGFLAILASVGYFTLVRPLRKRINPLYAAKQVERTIDDNKNSVTGYVDAQEKGDLNPIVKAALASRAAMATADADVNRAVDHRSLLYIGGVAIAFLLALVVLFFVFRPAPFVSFAKRTFVPFTPTPIETQTQLTITKPEPEEPTITTGQSITVAVHVKGKVPAANGPDRVRLLIRHNPADPNYDELPMVQGETSRDWELRVPDYLIQNGFWYKVAGGDAVTPEYRVTVRSLPMFTEFQATYEYPKYLRRLNDTANDPVIRAYRGTTVTLVARANRDVRDGLMVIEPGNARVVGTPVPGKTDSLQFVFKVTESGRYKLSFNAANGERSAEPYSAPITVEADLPPQIVINKPEEDEIRVPANGQVAIDGKVGDDFGIDTIMLKMKIVGAKERELKPVPFLNGKSTSFRREKDDTWPTDVTYKGSIDLAKLQKEKDAAGLALDPTLDFAEGTVIEFWLEATDNCTEPKPNVGKSAPKRIVLLPPKTEEMDKQQLDQQKEARQNEEKKHNDQQKQKLDNEKRDPKQNNNGQQQPKPGEKGDNGKKGDEKIEPKPADKMGEGNPPPKGGEKNPPDGKKENPGMGMGMNDPSMPPTNPMQPMNPNDPNMMGMGQPNQAPMPKSPDDKTLEKTADDFNKQIENENKNGGAAKPNSAPNEQEKTDPGKAKPQPKDGAMGGMNNPAETKPEPKQPNPNDPMKGDAAPSAAKPEGNIEKPQDPATPKPENKPEGMNGQKGAAPSEPRTEPFGAPPGTDKETPKEPQPASKDPNTKQDAGSGSTAKPATQKKDGDPAGMPNAGDKKDPAADAGTGAKPPMKDPTRGDEKPSTQPKGPPPTDQKPDAKPEAGDAKPDTAPPAAGTKPKPTDDMMGKGMDADAKPSAGANDQKDPKNPNDPKGTGAADVKPDDMNKQPMGGGVDKGMDKPKPEDKGTPNAGGDGKEPKLDPEELKKIEEAAKNLNSSDQKKKDDARKTLDKAVGEEKRKELEQIANDLNSDDPKKREAAQKKLDELKDKLKGNGKGPDAKEPPKPTDEQLKEIENAVKDLQNPDPAKKQEAQKKLDKMVGEANRKEIEQLMNDLNSDDPKKREAAQKKLEDLKNQMKNGKGDPKGQEPTQQEIDDLLKKAQDLNSTDDKKRQQAEKDLDEKIGKENRQKIQEQMKNPKPNEPPTDPEKLKKQMEEWRQGLGQGTPNKGAMESKKKQLETAELNLQKFESDEYRKKLQASKGWTNEEYNKFLKDYEDYVKKLKNDVAAGDKPPMPGGPETGTTFGSPGSGKVEPTKPGGPDSGVGGPTVAPPGFEDAQRKFQKALEEALKKKQP